MQKINFKNKPDTTSPINASNLNALQDNVENAIDEQKKNYAMVFYQNTIQNGVKWSHRFFKPSSSWTVGEKISCDDAGMVSVTAKSVKISVKMTLAETSYNASNEIIIFDGTNNHQIRFANARDYNISDYIIKNDVTTNFQIQLRKYTDNENNQLITTDTINYMSVEVIE